MYFSQGQSHSTLLSHCFGRSAACTKLHPETLTPQTSSCQETSSWSILQSEITPCFTPFWRMMKWLGRAVTAIGFTSAPRRQDGENREAAMDRTTPLQEMMGDQFHLNDVRLHSQTPEWHSVLVTQDMRSG